MKLYLYELFYHIIFLAIGISITLGVRQKDDAISRVLIGISYFVGMATVFVLALALFFLNLNVSLSVPVALLLSIPFIVRAYSKLDLSELKKVGRLLGFLLMIFCIVVYSKINVMSFDSYQYVLLAKKIAFGIYDSDRLVAYSITLPLLQSIPMGLWGVDVVNSLVPVSSVVSVMVVAFFVAERVGDNFRRIALPLGLVLLSFLSCYFFYFGSFYLIPNMLSGAILVVALISAYYFKTGSGIYFICFFLMLTLFSLLRVEGFVFSLLLLPFYFKVLAVRGYAPIFWPYYTFGGVLISWFVYLYLTFPGVTGDFYTASRLKGLIAVVVFMLGIPLIIRYHYFRMLVRYSSEIILGTLVLAIAVLWLYDPERANVNFISLGVNLDWKGFWGKLWYWLVIPYAAIAVTVLFGWVRSNYFRSTFFFVTSFFAMLIVIFFFRGIPLRTGFGDSGNRMFLHVYPSVMVMIMLGVAGLLDKVGCSRKLP